jgi:queuine tRNA-ribosyltransferase
LAERLETLHGSLDLPAFLPDATRGVLRSVDADDAHRSGITALMVNSLHLGDTPGLSLIKAQGGIHRFMGWDAPIASDSGGFQVYSLTKAGLGSVSQRGFSYSLKPGAKRRLLSAERCVQQQLALGSDVMFCLDYCTHPDDPPDVQRESVDLTLRWAREGKEVADRAAAERGGAARPLLFGVVQGGSDLDLRRRCAEGLLEIGFDGYGFGGWPIDDGRLVDAVGMVAELLPPEAPKHALGIGRPENVVAAWRAGYTMFDCTLPTRNARRAVAYVFTDEPIGDGTGFYRQLRLDQERFRRDHRPLEEGCDCLLCTRYTRSYLAHLVGIGDTLADRLLTIHNLRFYTRLVDRMDG